MTKSHLLAWGSIAALLAWIFAPALSGHSSFVFRDAAHFYHPLFEYIRDQWGIGWVSLWDWAPLWNPYENIGTPLAAETTSSVFYPGKLIFALPLPYTLLYNLYIVAHVALAAVTGFWLARHWGASVLAAALAAVSYAFCGNVLFQYANVVFLVGASWLPAALLLADRLVRERNWRPAAGLGVVMALMVTGGDPQMAYNAGLLASLNALLVWRARPAREPAAGAELQRGRRPHIAVLLALSAVTGLALSAIQILPAWEANRLSLRGTYDAPRSVYELAASIGNADGADSPWYSGFIGPKREGHRRQIYEFSVGPWRAIEYLWPNVAGRQFPTYHRWLDVLPAEGRVWTPSLYMGLLPVVLAATCFSLRRSSPIEVRRLSWMIVWGALASMGIYGIAWAVREVTTWCGGSGRAVVADEVGGVYWWMTVVLPGYVYFRYPAKLLVVTSLGLSLLAARGWDAVWQTPSPRLRRFWMVLAGGSVSALTLASFCWPSLCAYCERIPPEPLFGPFDCVASWHDLSLGLKQTALLAMLFAVLLGKRQGGKQWRWAPAACCLLTVVDLAVAQSPLVPFAPADAWREPTTWNRARDSRTVRSYRDPACRSTEWSRTSWADRQFEGLRWDRNTLLPKYNLPMKSPLVEASGTLASCDYQMLWDVARRHGDPSNGMPHASLLDLVGARLAIVPERFAPDSPRIAEGVVWVERAQALPRAWIVHQVEVLPPLAGRATSWIDERTEAVLFPAGRPRDWRATAVVETDALQDIPLSEPSPPLDESCDVASAAYFVEIEARLAAPGLVVLADTYYPGWELSVDSGEGPRAARILRTNRVMRGVMLPVGRHRLVYRYRPTSVLIGAAISSVSVMALALSAAGAIVLRRRRSRATP